MISTSVISWLIHEGRLHRDPSELTAAFSKQCVTAGIPLSRVRVVLLVLPPQDLSYLLTWLRGQGIDETRIPPDEYPELLRASPLLPLANGESEVRHHLCDEPSFEIEVLNTLKAEGHTDYVAQLLPAADRTRSRAMVYVTDHEGGFTDEHLDALRQIRPCLALVTEVHAQAQRARTLLDTYLGKKTGQQVLEGKIRRGDGRTIKSVVWFCDLRNFTPLSEQLSSDELLQMLNDFFGVMTAAVEQEEGEVLKFIGDAMLAIFPVEPEEESTADDVTDDNREALACEHSMAAVKTVRSQMKIVNEQRDKANAATIDFGIALHLGEVHYGNIGGDTRLDFTVIGPAVNLASRIESQTKELGQKVLVSDAFYKARPEGLEPCAEVKLKGMSEPHMLYCVSPE